MKLNAKCIIQFCGQYVEFASGSSERFKIKFFFLSFFKTEFLRFTVGLPNSVGGIQAHAHLRKSLRNQSLIFFLGMH